MRSKLRAVDWLGDSPATSHLFGALLAVVILAVTGTLLVIGVTVTTASLSDVFILLEGGWRTLQGQRFSLDYYSPLGPVMPLFMALGMLIAGPSAQAFVYINILVFILVSLYAWMLGQGRMPPFLAFIFAVWTGFMIAGTHIYASAFTTLGYAALYNRYAMAFLGLVLVESLTQARDRDSRRELLQGGATGVLLITLFFLKANFFVVAILGLLLGWLLVGRSRLSSTGLGLGILSAAMPILIYLKFSLFGVIGDLNTAIQVRSASSIALKQVGRAFNALQAFFSFAFFLLAAIPGRCVRFRSHKNHPELFFRLGVTVLLLFFVLGHLFLYLTNSQGNTPLLLAIGIFILAAHHFRNCAESHGKIFLLWSAGIFIVGATLLSDVGSIGYSAYLKFWNKPAIAKEKFDSNSLSGLRVLAKDLIQRQYILRINEGINLVRKVGSSRDKILTFDFSNPFPLALSWKSPTGDILWWHYGLTFTERIYPPAESVLGGASIIMIPLKPVDLVSRNRMLQAYHSALEERGGVLGRSNSWIAIAPNDTQKKDVQIKFHNIGRSDGRIQLINTGSLDKSRPSN